MSLSSAGLISGTPTAAGSYSFSLLVVDPVTGTSASIGYSLKVSPLSITGPGMLPVATAGTPYTYTFGVTGASGAVTWTIQAPGAFFSNNLNTSPTGTISGTPVNGNQLYSITVVATSGASSVTRQFTLYIRTANLTPPGASLVSTVLADATVGQTYTSTLSPNSGLAPFSWSVASGSLLPPGLTLISGAQLPPSGSPGATLIAGQPTAAGQYVFDLVVTDASGAQARRTFSLTVSSITILSAAALRTAVAGQAYAQQLTAVGGSAPYTFTASLLANQPTADLFPPGFTLSSAGLISGTTASTGAYAVMIRVTDSAGHTFARTFTLTVNNASGAAPPAFRATSGNLNDTSVGKSATQNLSTNGPSTYSWSLVDGALPPGMTLQTSQSDPTSWFVQGQPSAAGIYTYRLRATDTTDSTKSADHTFTLTVSPMQVVSPTAFAYVLPPGQIGVAYSTQVRVAGGTPPYSFSVSPAGPIPVGLTLHGDGTLDGTPTQVGVYSLGLVVTDSASPAPHVYRLPFLPLVVTQAGTPAPLSIATGSSLIDNASVGVPYRVALIQQRGGVAPFTWTLASGSLPPGLSIMSGSNGVPDYLAGIPTAAGTYSFSATVSDSSGQSVTTPVVEIDVSPVALLPDGLATGRVGTPYLATLSPIGGVAPYTLQAVPELDLPPGLTLSPAGVLSGTPTAPGLFLMGVEAIDAASPGPNGVGRLVRVAVDNAAGEAPAVTFASRGIEITYTQTFPDPGPIAVAVNTTSSAQAYTLAVEGLPDATLSAPGGTAPGSVTLDLHVTTLGVGTYSGVLALKSDGSANLIDAVPVTIRVSALPPCTYGVFPPSSTAGPGGGAGGFALSTPGNCSWTASVSDPWITLTSSDSGTGNATFDYTVAPNVGAGQRTGTITIGSAVYTITQFGSACSFVINPGSLSAPASGGIASIGVAASDASCSWAASGLSASPASGVGSGSVLVTVPANPNPGSRQLTATIAGQTLTVTQAGIDCTVALGSSLASFTDTGGVGSTSVTTGATCGYATTSAPSWVTVDSGGSRTGPGMLHFIVDPNSATTPRSGSIVVGGQTLTISQGAAACSVTLDTSLLGSPFGAGGGVGTIGVITNGDNCGWVVTSNANWATGQPNASSGSGSVSIAIAASPGTTPRNASFSIGGQLVTVTQAGQACTYALQSPGGSVPAAGGAGSVGVLTPASCSWTPVSSAPGWLTTSSPGGTGSGDASFVAMPNPDPSPRSATLTVAGLVYTVTQPAAACTFTLGAPGAAVPPDGTGGSTFSVTSGSPSCTPAPVSYANWITVNSTTWDGSSWTVNYSAQPNPLASARMGTIQVGDQTFSVTESVAPAACRYSLHAYGAVFNRGGGAGDIFGSGSAVSCDPGPTIGTDQPSFITLGGLQGPVNDIFTQPFSVTPFDTPLISTIRLGHITFGGQLFVVKQLSW